MQVEGIPLRPALENQNSKLTHFFRNVKNPNLTPQRDPHRRVTTIYLIDGTPLIVEVIEWGSGSTPAVVRTLNNQVWRQGIDASWSCYPNQVVADAFRQMRQAALKRQPTVRRADSADSRNAA